MVVAHPDDEILWLSSTVAAADRIVFCFGDPFERPKISAARRRAVAALPLPRLLDLGMPESGAGFSVDWERALPTATGVEIADRAARGRYEANYPRLTRALRLALAGYDAVYTHNPWGEYGHAEHIQVFRAISSLQSELGYELRFSNYVGGRSWPLARRLGREPCWTQRATGVPDRLLAHRLMRVYRQHDAWTWTRFHRWPAHETIYARPPPGDPRALRPLSGEWLLDVAGLRWWPPPWRAARRRLD